MAFKFIMPPHAGPSAAPILKDKRDSSFKERYYLQMEIMALFPKQQQRVLDFRTV